MNDKIIIGGGVVLVMIILAVSLLPQPTPQPGPSAIVFEELGFPELASVGIASAQGVGYVYSQAKDTLSVNGQATINADPDEVRLSIGAITESASAQASMQQNADIMQNVRNALAAKGISGDRVSTSSFSVSPKRIYNDITRTYDVTGYTTTHILLVKLSDVNKAGEIIDAASGAGANNIGSIQFTLSETKQKELRLQALRDAARNAKEKANVISSELGVSLVKPTHISEGFVSVLPYQRSYDIGIAASEAAPTAISPGEVSVSATLSVVYEIG